MKRIKDYQVSKVVGLDIKTRDLLNLFCAYMGTDASEVSNRLYRQWFFNSLNDLEDQYPEQWAEWAELRQALHKR